MATAVDNFDATCNESAPDWNINKFLFLF
jgi:hypothetical protein